MKVHRFVEEIPEIVNPVLTMGTFDGVHTGHLKTISHLRRNAERIKGETVLLSFEPHPRLVLYPKDHQLELIQSVESRIASLAEAGIDHLILYPFTIEFSKTSAEDFVRNFLVKKLGVKVMTVGYNHRFGKSRQGDQTLLRAMGKLHHFEVDEVPAFKVGNEAVSSTKIRNAVHSGDVMLAAKFLGRPFTFCGTVVKGNQLGTKLGFPTANLELEFQFQLVPGLGTYAVRAIVNDKYVQGMCNIGIRPTVIQSGERRIELHIFDFHGDLYGKKIELEFIERIRDEIKFSSPNELQQQLTKDEITCRNILSARIAGV